MESLEKTSEKPADESGIQKQYNHYENPSEIIDNKEKFEAFKGHKLKKTWFNERGKRCLESFLYLFDEKKEGQPDQYVYLEILKGVAGQDRKRSNTEDLFSSACIIFAGYIPDKELEEKLKLKMQGVNY